MLELRTFSVRKTNDSSSVSLSFGACWFLRFARNEPHHLRHLGITKGWRITWLDLKRFSDEALAKFMTMVYMVY